MPNSFIKLLCLCVATTFGLVVSGCGGKDAEPEVCEESPAGSGYCLVWADEFDGVELDLKLWSIEQNCWGGGNNEAQCYVDNAANLWLDGNYLHITAIEENAIGASLPEDDPAYDPGDTSGTGTYTSARIRTKYKGDWRYGRFEIRAKLPQGQGTWPAIWMLPTDSVYGGWAASGEIDIMEAVNLKVGGENRVYGTLHFGSQWPNNLSTSVEYPMPEANPADGFHTYAVEWELGEIRWYVDGDHYATQTQSGWYSTAALANPAAPFDEHFHLILNLAVGGAWAGQVNDTGIDATVFPQTMLVDYVRVYECSHDPLTGKGCASRDADFESPAGHTPPTPPDPDETTAIIFDGTVFAPYQWFIYTVEGTIDYELKTLPEPYGEVAEVTFAAADGIGFFQAPNGLNLSGYAAVQFDWRLLADPRGEGAGYIFRADCNFPCSSGNWPLTPAAFGSWQTTAIDLADLAANGLNTTAVNTPFVIGPSSAAEGAVIQLDNIRLVK